MNEEKKNGKYMVSIGDGNLFKFFVGICTGMREWVYWGSGQLRTGDLCSCPLLGLPELTTILCCTPNPHPFFGRGMDEQ